MVFTFENQFKLILRHSTTEVIHFVRKLLEQYRYNKRDLHILFIDQEKHMIKSLLRSLGGVSSLEV